jgi:hypothetical protein
MSSKIQIKQGNLKDAMVKELRWSIKNLNFQWRLTGLNYTPKIHGILAHAADQVEFLGGIGDMFEDDLEHLHQISKLIQDRTCRIKNTAQQAHSHSQMEAKFNNKDVFEKTRELQLSSTRVY